MNLSIVRDLMLRYGLKISNNTITDEELGSLLNLRTFPGSKGYNGAAALSDENYTTTDAMLLFALTLINSSIMRPQSLELFIQQLITRVSKSETSSTSLIVVFLAYLKAVRSPKFRELRDTLVTAKQTLENTIDHSIASLSPIFMNIPTRIQTAIDTGPKIEFHLAPDVLTPTKLSMFQHQIHDNKMPTPAELTRQGYITSLNGFVKTYRAGATLEAIRREKKINGEYPATLKANVAEDLIKIVNTDDNDRSNLQKAFLNSLEENGLTTEQFFKGKTKDKLKNDDLYDLLRSAPSLYITQSTNHGKACELVEEENNPYSGLNATNALFKTATNDKNIFITQLHTFVEHYASTTVQTHESIFNSSKKGQSKAKANVASGLIEALGNNNTDIKSIYAELLSINSLTSDAFLSGKSKEYLSEDLIQFLGNIALSSPQN